MAEQLVPLGEIATTHGLDGWLKLNPFNADTAVLVAGRLVHLDLGDRHAAFELAADAKPFKKQFLIRLRGLDHIDSARPWVGATLSIDEAVLEPLEAGQYYHYQVIGFEVLHKDGRRIGTIASLLSTAGGDILVVIDGDKEYLIPAVREMVDKVDFDRRTMIVDPPDGLLDL